MKEYRNMESGEQTQWLKVFSAFLTNDYAVLKAKDEGWEEAFERGLKVLEPMTICQRFVKEARTYRDFDRRVKRMAFFIEELRKQVVEVDGSLLTKAMAAPPKRRAGRPTKKEQMQMQAEKALKSSGKMDAVARIAGMPTGKESMVGDLFGSEGRWMREEGRGKMEEGRWMREEGRGKMEEGRWMREEGRGKKEDSYDSYDSWENNENYNENQNENQDENEDQNQNENGGGKAVRLQDIKGMLSGELQEQVDGLALLRGEAARMSENAKEAALAGKSQDVVAGYAQKAAELTEKVEIIYKAIDIELAKKYIRARMCKEHVFEGMRRDDVLARTEYYYKKVVAESELFEGMYISQLAAVQERKEREKKNGMTDKELKKLVKNVHDYFMRKDVKKSEARLKGMEERMEQLRKLGVNVEDYEAIYNKEKEELGV